jgi:hypothetical protein
MSRRRDGIARSRSLRPTIAGARVRALTSLLINHEDKDDFEALRLVEEARALAGGGG